MDGFQKIGIQETVVHQTLRRATSAAHHALDHHPLMRQLMGDPLTRDLYGESLAAMHQPHARLERQVHASDHHLRSGIALSGRLGRLEADLSDLGWLVAPIPRVAPDPRESRAAWWGRVYVLEGSRQGAAVISRHVRSGLGDTVPIRFLDDPIAPNRRHALRALRGEELASPGDLDRAVASARAAFADYRAGLVDFVRAAETARPGRARKR